MRLPVFFALLHFSSGPLWPAFCFGTGKICRPFWPLPSRRTRCRATSRWPVCRRCDPGVRDPSPLVFAAARVSNTPPLRNVLARAARLAWYRTGESEEGGSVAAGHRTAAASFPTTLLLVLWWPPLRFGVPSRRRRLLQLHRWSPRRRFASAAARVNSLALHRPVPLRRPARPLSFLRQHPHPSGAWFVGRSACSRSLPRAAAAAQCTTRSSPLPWMSAPSAISVTALWSTSRGMCVRGCVRDSCCRRSVTAGP